MAGILGDILSGGDNQTPETPEDAANRQRLGQGLLGLAAGMLSQGASRLPNYFSTALGTGLTGMLGAMPEAQV